MIMVLALELSYVQLNNFKLDLSHSLGKFLFMLRDQSVYSFDKKLNSIIWNGKT